MQNIATVVSNFVLALLALIAHPKTPKAARTLFKDTAVEFINYSKRGFLPGETLQDGLLRAFGVKSLQTASSNPPTESARADSSFQYAPEIEARRADYERIAETIATITRLQQSRLPGLFDCGDYAGQTILNALDDHVCAVTMEMDWFDARTLRRFYVEGRLHADQLALERRAVSREWRKERVGKRLVLTPHHPAPGMAEGEPLSGEITDEITHGLMAVIKDEKAWVGTVSRRDDERGIIATAQGNEPFFFDKVDLVKLDWPPRNQTNTHM